MEAYMFPGQGSQKKGMGEELFTEYADYVRVSNEILGYSIEDLCLNDEESRLQLTQYTQPALYIVNALTYFKYCQENEEPDYLIGHSLGEYNALLAADVFNFETGLKLVKKRGELMSRVTGGGMAAVVGMSHSKIKTILEDHELTSIDVANINTPSQIVLAGPREDLLQAQTIFENSGSKLFLSLKVSGPFHSRYMEKVQGNYKEYVDNFLFNEPRIPIISNVDALPYAEKNIKSNLVEQLVSSVKWDQTVQYLMEKGVSEFKEIGPGSVLTGLVTKIKSEKPERVHQLKEKQIAISDQVSTKQSPVKKRVLMGDQKFCEDYNVVYPYVAGSMQKGISSPQLVSRMSQNGFLSFLGTASLKINEIEDIILDTKRLLRDGQSFGCNLSANLHNPQKENEIIEIFLKYNINSIEASGFWAISSSLIKFRAKGLHRSESGKVIAKNKILVKLSRCETAVEFMSEIPQSLIDPLLKKGEITFDEAKMLEEVPIVDDICVMGDSGGESSLANLSLLLPTIVKLRNEASKENIFDRRIRIGAGGGIGTPEAASIAFILGADFVLTGSINQCTVEAKTSDLVKDILQNIDLHDLSYVPSANDLEVRGQTQVVKKGMFFPARANKLHDLLKQYKKVSEIDFKTKELIEERYLNEKIINIIQTNEHQSSSSRRTPKSQIQEVLKFYLKNTVQLAIKGEASQKVNFNIYCGPALGAFNRWIKGTELENWRNRNIDVIAKKLITETEKILEERSPLLETIQR
ncbi:ACP S-malonyltransferase [Shouchella miscanthi]|uniref:ACP S-malonyltransferase n=1 Tax=Shouchella miscanthi TaxID=2598861 RepID=UPI00119F692E|nr:ACP S-malonyltransferase [Shouchella miscanthi]